MTRSADAACARKFSLVEAVEALSSTNGSGTTPDLHSMGRLLLGSAGLAVFDFAVMLHFVSILISYSLAGSIAYA